MKVYWPNSIHWPESVKPVTFDQVDVLIEKNDKKRYEDSANHVIGEYVEIDQSMQKNMDSFENTCQNQQLEEEEDEYVHTQREDSIAESKCGISPFEAFLDIRRHEGEDRISLYNKMINIFMQILSHYGPTRPLFVAQFARAWKPELAYWPE